MACQGVGASAYQGVAVQKQVQGHQVEAASRDAFAVVAFPASFQVAVPWVVSAQTAADLGTVPVAVQAEVEKVQALAVWAHVAVAQGIVGLALVQRQVEEA